MLRKELLPGDVFYYSSAGPEYTLYVGEIVPGQPKAAWGKSKSTSRENNSPVVLVWRDPALGGLQNQPGKEDPAHYTSQSPEPIDAIDGWGLNYRLGNVVKYVARAGKKDGVPSIKDLKKAIRYLAREINAQEGKKGWAYAVE